MRGHELTIEIRNTVDMFNQETGEFIYIAPQTLHFEHCLYNVAIWESKWKKPFISRSANDNDKTAEEVLDYIRIMCKEHLDKDTFTYITTNVDIINQIKAYIDDPRTATTITEQPGGSREVPTTEVLYYDMTALQIPFECQYWHFNRLLMLIRVCAEKNKPPKKMSAADTMRRNAALNAQRRAKLNSKG